MREKGRFKPCFAAWLILYSFSMVVEVILFLLSFLCFVFVVWRGGGLESKFQKAGWRSENPPEPREAAELYKRRSLSRKNLEEELTRPLSFGASASATRRVSAPFRRGLWRFDTLNFKDV